MCCSHGRTDDFGSWKSAEKPKLTAITIKHRHI